MSRMNSRSSQYRQTPIHCHNRRLVQQPTRYQLHDNSGLDTYHQASAPPQIPAYNQPPIYHQPPTPPRLPAHLCYFDQLQYPNRYQFNNHNEPYAVPVSRHIVWNELNMDRRIHQNDGLPRSSYERLPTGSEDFSSAEQGSSRNSTRGMNITSSFMTGLYPNQSEEDHEQPDKSHPVQAPCPSQANPQYESNLPRIASSGVTFNTNGVKNFGREIGKQTGSMLAYNPLATEAGYMLPFNPDPLGGTLKYNPSSPFSTSLEDDIGRPEDLDSTKETQQGGNTGIGNTPENEDFRADYSPPENQELETDHFPFEHPIKEGQYPSLRSKKNSDERTTSEASNLHGSHTNQKNDTAYQSPEPTQGNLHSSTKEKKISKRKRHAVALNETGLDGRTSKDSKDSIRFRPNRGMEWYDGNTWREAVLHNDIRAELIAETENLGQYIYPRARGAHPLDITSFSPDQVSWGPERIHWATMPHKLLFRFECKNFPVPDYDVGIMMHQGRVVLDSENCPVKDYHDIPKTLSSNTDAYLIENISRLDTRIARSDFLARMPKTRETRKGPKPLGGLSFIGQRLRRFRVKNAIVSWKGREDSSQFKEYVEGLLSEEALRNNSTEELGCLSKLQQEEVFMLLRGKHLSRAGKNALTQEERKKRAEVHEKKILRLKDEEAMKTADYSSEKVGHKRKRADSEVFEPDSLVDPSSTQPAATHQMLPDLQNTNVLDSQQSRFSPELFQTQVTRPAEPSGDVAAPVAQDDEPPQKRRKVEGPCPLNISFRDAGTGFSFQSPPQSDDYTPPTETFYIDPTITGISKDTFQDDDLGAEQSWNLEVAGSTIESPSIIQTCSQGNTPATPGGELDNTHNWNNSPYDRHHETTEGSTGREDQMKNNDFISEEEIQEIFDLYLAQN